MGFSVHWSWLAALSCLLSMGGEVWCDCTIDRMQMEGGDYKLTKKLKEGSMLIYNCTEGYYPYPHLFRICQSDGTWNPPPKRISRMHQRCRLVECPDPNVLEYGTVQPAQQRYYVHNVTTYECYSGNRLRGSSRRVCLPNGKWSGRTPVCSRDTGDHCANPGVPAGGSRRGNNFGIDEKVTYSCRHNMILMGSKERICLENGQWTGTEPECYYEHTYDTPQEVSRAFGSAIKSSLTTLESVDDIQGERKIRITKDGILNMYIAMDISDSVELKDVESSKKAVISLIKKISSFSVTPNYDILFFSSEIYRVVNILNYFNGIASNPVQKVTDFEVGERNTGTDLHAVFKSFLSQMAFIKQQVGEESFKNHRHVFIVFTDGGFNMGGEPDPTVAKIKNMVYMNHTVGSPKNESRDDYLDIYIFGIGGQIFEKELKAITAGTDGRHFFKMKDIGTLEETFDEIINEDDVKGLCGLYKDYGQGKEDRKKFPWLAVIHVQNERKSLKCLGSLVAPRYVLTAAHCFTFDDLPGDVKVEINDGHGIEKPVKTFKLHEKYNVNARVKQGVREFYDYDVALIELMEDVEISASVRPICIPCTKETNTALKLADTSTCQEQEQLLLKTHLEILNFLSTSNNKIYQKQVHAKLGGNRDECIQHALEAEGITTTDPKKAVTDNFLCTGGLMPFRDHIACTGDSGGAVFRNYEQRTVQVALVSWGTKNLCKGGGLVESDRNARDFHINLFRVVPFLKSVLENKTEGVVTLQFLEH